MCTSHAAHHVSITGMEKVVPSLEDMGIMLRLLIRSATGQRISSYVTTVTGPRRSDDEDGPEEFHLVIVDNGRSRLLADPELREALYCLRCGACLNACPSIARSADTPTAGCIPVPLARSSPRCSPTSLKLRICHTPAASAAPAKRLVQSNNPPSNAPLLAPSARRRRQLPGAQGHQRPRNDWL